MIPVNRRVLLIAVLALVLGGCADRDDAVVRFGIPTAPVTLDPRFATDSISDRVTRLLHRPLVGFNAAGEPRPDLARWSERDALTYHFVLEAEARFSDGTPVRAVDVVSTYRSVLDPAVASPHRQSLANIAGLFAVDDRTVAFRLRRPDPLFPGVLVIGIMAAADLAADGERRWDRLASGAFEFVRRPRAGRLRLRRLADGVEFEFVTVKDESVRALKLINGELDILQGNLSPYLHRWLSQRRGVHAGQVPGTTFAYLGFRFDDAVAGEAAIRRAVAHAVDRDAIMAHLFAGAARPASGLFPPEHWASSSAVTAPAYDPPRARQLLTEAGLAPGAARLTLKTSTDPFRVRVATVLQQQLAAVGIALEVRSLDWGTFYGDVKAGRFQMYSLSWVGLRLPDIYRYAFHSSATPPRGANRGRYRSAAADRLIESAERSSRITERGRIYADLQRQLLDDLPYVPLWYEDHLYVTRASVEGYTTNADGHFDALARTNRRP